MRKSFNFARSLAFCEKTRSWPWSFWSFSFTKTSISIRTSLQLCKNYWLKLKGSSQKRSWWLLQNWRMTVRIQLRAGYLVYTMTNWIWWCIKNGEMRLRFTEDGKQKWPPYSPDMAIQGILQSIQFEEGRGRLWGITRRVYKCTVLRGEIREAFQRQEEAPYLLVEPKHTRRWRSGDPKKKGCRFEIQRDLCVSVEEAGSRQELLSPETWRGWLSTAVIPCKNWGKIDW